jgi:VCBS repeat-containing protein
MQRTSAGPTGVVFNGRESSNSDQLTSSIGSTSSLDSVTVEMWVKLKDSGSAQNDAGSMLFSWDNGSTSYNIYHFQDQLGFNTFQSQLYGINSSSYNNVWTHLVFVMTDTGGWPTQKIYVNGVNQTLTCRVGTACNNSDLRAFASNGNFVLMNHPNAANIWNAKSDLGIVRIYNRELSEATIQSIYNSTSASYVEAADTTAPTITGPSSATGATSSISIAENSTAVHTFTANESVTWSRSGTDSSFFSITSAGGVLTITARDFEAPADVGSNNTYEVTITATDTAGNATNQTLTVTITNVNEAPTITTASSNPTHAISQAENISSVITYTGSDVDAGTTLTWSLSGTDAAAFTINSSSGVLAFAANPDFEAPQDADTNNSYILIVTVSDGSLSDTQTLTITITNANESGSVGAPTSSGALNKGIATTISVSANTAGKVRFFVGGKRISTCLARTTTGSYPTLTATCSWRPAVTGRQVLTARLTPTDNTFSAATSAATTVQVVRRGTTR